MRRDLFALETLTLVAGMRIDCKRGGNNGETCPKGEKAGGGCGQHRERKWSCGSVWRNLLEDGMWDMKG